MGPIVMLCDDWDEKLACAEFAINNSWQESVQDMPFFLNYGQHPLTPATVQLPSKVPRASEYAEGIAKSVKQARRCMEAAQQEMRRVDWGASMLARPKVNPGLSRVDSKGASYSHCEGMAGKGDAEGKGGDQK
eukprot:1161757-Pelagomonas_calceolata.AAC.8